MKQTVRRLLNKVHTLRLATGTAFRLWDNNALWGDFKDLKWHPNEDLFGLETEGLASMVKERYGNKIALLHHRLGDSLSGGVRCIIEVLNRLVDLGFSTECLVESGPFSSDWLPAKFTILPLEKIGSYDGILLACYSPQASLLCDAHQAKLRLYWVHGYEPGFVHNSLRWRIESARTYLMKNVFYMANSYFTATLLDHIYRCPVLPHIVSPGIDFALFKYTPWSERGSEILRIGSLDRKLWLRGTDILGEIADDLSEKYFIDVDLHIFSGIPQDEMYKAYGLCHFYIDPSRSAGFSMAPLEAMACGTVPVTTYFGATTFILNGYNGFIVAKDDIRRFAYTISKAWKQFELLTRISMDCHKSVARFTWENTARSILLNILYIGATV